MPYQGPTLYQGLIVCAPPGQGWVCVFLATLSTIPGMCDALEMLDKRRNQVAAPNVRPYSHQETSLPFPSLEASCSLQRIPGELPGLADADLCQGHGEAPPKPPWPRPGTAYPGPQVVQQCPEHAKPRLTPTALRAQMGGLRETKSPLLPTKNLPKFSYTSLLPTVLET